MEATLNCFNVVLMLSFIYFTNLQAQSIEPDLKTLSTGADLIVTGKVVDQKSQWNSEKSKIYTQVTIQVTEFLKGSNNQNRIVLTHLGAEVGNVGETYSHVPTFTNEEDVLVFIKRSDKNESLRVYMGEDGKMTFYQDKKTGEKVTSKNTKIGEIKKKIKGYVEKE